MRGVKRYPFCCLCIIEATVLQGCPGVASEIAWAAALSGEITRLCYLISEFETRKFTSAHVHDSKHARSDARTGKHAHTLTHVIAGCQGQFSSSLPVERVEQLTILCGAAVEEHYVLLHKDSGSTFQSPMDLPYNPAWSLCYMRVSDYTLHLLTGKHMTRNEEQFE